MPVAASAILSRIHRTVYRRAPEASGLPPAVHAIIAVMGALTFLGFMAAVGDFGVQPQLAPVSPATLHHRPSCRELRAAGIATERRI